MLPLGTELPDILLGLEATIFAIYLAYCLASAWQWRSDGSVLLPQTKMGAVSLQLIALATMVFFLLSWNFSHLYSRSIWV